MATKQILKGVLAGAAGTAAMTLHQKLRQSDAESSDDGDPWESAPAPAQAGKLALETLGLGPVSADAIPVLTGVMHWSYGSLWGGAYGLLRGRLAGPLFGLVVWAASYAQLVPMGIYDKPWNYPPAAIADEIGYHVTYGTTVALAFSRL